MAWNPQLPVEPIRLYFINFMNDGFICKCTNSTTATSIYLVFETLLKHLRHSNHSDRPGLVPRGGLIAEELSLFFYFICFFFLFPFSTLDWLCSMRTRHFDHFDAYAHQNAHAQSDGQIELARLNQIYYSCYWRKNKFRGSFYSIWFSCARISFRNIAEMI